VDDLTSTTPGSSGAEQIGSASISGVSGTTVYAQLSDIKTQLTAGTTFNTFSKIAVSGQSDVDADSKTDTLNLAAGTGIAISTNAATDTITITAQGNQAPGAHASTHITGGSDVIANAVAGGASGLMSGSDKAYLDSLAKNGEPFGVTAGTSTSYTVTASPPIGALADGVSVAVKWHTASGASPTISVNGLTAKPIWKPNGTAPTAGTLKQDAIATLRYSATANTTGAFILQGEGGSGTATSSDLLSGKTATADTGDLTGTMPNRAGDTVALSSVVSGTTLKLLALDGYRDGVDDYVTITDSDFVAGNILSGVNIFGLTGTLALGRKTAKGSSNFSNTSNPLTLTITGLSFAPATIAVYFNGTNIATRYYLYFYSSEIARQNASQATMYASHSGSAAQTTETDITCTLNASGFTLSISSNAIPKNGPVNWIAFE
jgi:hypothetical protein